MISEILWLTMWLDITLKCSIDFLSRFIWQRQQCSDMSIKFGEAFVEAFRFLGCCNGLILKGITFDTVIDWIHLPYLAVVKNHQILRTKAQLSKYLFISHRSSRNLIHSHYIYILHCCSNIPVCVVPHNSFWSWSSVVSLTTQHHHGGAVESTMWYRTIPYLRANGVR